MWHWTVSEGTHLESAEALQILPEILFMRLYLLVESKSPFHIYAVHTISSLNHQKTKQWNTVCMDRRLVISEKHSSALTRACFSQSYFGSVITAPWKLCFCSALPPKSEHASAFPAVQDSKSWIKPACLFQYDIPHVKRVPISDVSLPYFLYSSQTYENKHKTCRDFFLFFFLSVLLGSTVCIHRTMAFLCLLSKCAPWHTASKGRKQPSFHPVKFVHQPASAQWDSILPAWRNHNFLFLLKMFFGNNFLHYQRFAASPPVSVM